MVKRILVVDDDDMVRQTTKDILESAGYEVVTAINGKDALEKLKTEKVDLALVDFNMPEMNGLEFCRAVKSSTLDLKIAMLTASGYTRERDAEITALGVLAYVRKPFTARELLNWVKRLLG